jgi:hypothetical protein
MEHVVVSATDLMPVVSGALVPRRRFPVSPADPMITGPAVTWDIVLWGVRQMTRHARHHHHPRHYPILFSHLSLPLPFHHPHHDRILKLQLPCLPQFKTLLNIGVGIIWKRVRLITCLIWPMAVLYPPLNHPYLIQTLTGPAIGMKSLNYQVDITAYQGAPVVIGISLLYAMRSSIFLEVLILLRELLSSAQ